MNRYMPIRKIAAAALAAIIATPAALAFIPSPWDVIVVAVIPVVIGYLVAEPVKDEVLLLDPAPTEPTDYKPV